MKHRIVGSLMLLSLAVIILPFWLDGAGLEEYQSTRQQPMMPEAGMVNAIENVDPSDQQVIELSPVIIVEESPTSTEQAENKAEHDPDDLLDQQGLPNGWVVQLGNFGNRANAVRLRDKVIKAGFAAYMVPNEALFKVIVGPEFNRSKAEVLQNELKNKFKVMESIVTLYEVEKP